MGAHQSSSSMILISLGSGSTVFMEASSMTWKNTSIGIGLLRAAAFARSSTCVFVSFNVLHGETFEVIFQPPDMAKYFSSVASLAIRSFSIWPSTTFESVHSIHIWTPMAPNL
jgi:hypothetical protein